MPTIPPLQSARIQAIQRIHWDSLDESLDALDDEIASRARQAMVKIRASNYNRNTIKRETKAITANTADKTSSLLAAQVESAALYAQRAADTIRAWQVAGRLAEGVEHLSVSDSAMARALRPGVSIVDAEAALARIKIAPLQSPAAQAKAFQDFGATQGPHVATEVTSGTKVMDKLRKLGLVRKSKEIGLSRRLHNSAAMNTTVTEKAVGQAIREADSMNKAGRELVNALNSEGTPLSINRKLTKPLARLKRANRDLELLSVNKADPDALKAATKEYNAAFNRIRKVAESRVDGRGGYQELLQIIKKQGHKGTDKALARWLDEKQRSHAERIVETETSAAYRAREYEQHANKSYITGFYWRRSAGMVSLDLKRKKDIARTKPRRKGGKRGKRKTKGRPCGVCPALADQFFPVEYAREYPRGAHPNCRCWYEWVYSHEGLGNSPITQADVDWFEGLEA